MTTENAGDVFPILSLDGGGAKGFYTLGVLRELEKLLGAPLSSRFRLIFGTSTGSIIAALLAMGKTVSEVKSEYCVHLPVIMKARHIETRSAALRSAANTIFDKTGFAELQTGVGIVATEWITNQPKIFKSLPLQAHGMQHSFVPGFGVSVADAVIASCSAYPLFDIAEVTLGNHDVVKLVDGGFSANNPMIYAIIDALSALSIDGASIRTLSVGVGTYPGPSWWDRKHLLFEYFRLYRWSSVAQMLDKAIDMNAASLEAVARLAFKDRVHPPIRINDAFTIPELATDLLEHDLKKLSLLEQRGAMSFASREKDIRTHFSAL